MKTTAAILWEVNAPWSVEEIELDAPKAGEVLVKIAASGMCHSDEHLTTGDLPFALPIIGGHEGAGVVEAVGEGVSWLEVGDHVVFGFIPSCGRCPSCSTGHQNLCDLGALMGLGLQVTDGTSRHHAGGKDLTLMCMLGTFAKHTVVNEASCIKIEKDVPLEKACLLGCGVVTGWGSAVYAADVAPGDTVVVGVNVVEGTRKRTQAFEGVVIAKRNRGLNSSFIVRKISSGEGVERTFQTYSPLIAGIEVKRRGDVRRAKLYYLRDRSGKSARIKEKLPARKAAVAAPAAE